MTGGTRIPKKPYSARVSAPMCLRETLRLHPRSIVLADLSNTETKAKNDFANICPTRSETCDDETRTGLEPMRSVYTFIYCLLTNSSSQYAAQRTLA
jgi:hypothetical protein